MRVLLTIPELTAATGGPPMVVTQFAAALRDAGDTVMVLCSERPGLANVPIPDGIRVQSLPWQTNPWTRYRQFRQAAQVIIHSVGIQVLHDHGLWLPQNAAAASAAQAAGCALVLQPCGMLQDWSFGQQALKKNLAWWLYQHRLMKAAAAVITTSADERRETAARLGGSARVHCIPHGVSLPTLAATLVKKRQAVFLGRLHPKKQIDLLLRAWAEICPADWQLCIAGSGEPGYEARLHALAAELGLGTRVRFMGAVQGEAKSALLAESQLFLQPSLQENFGLSVAEALAHGLPALTTRAMPWAQLETARCGWSVSPDAHAVTTALRTALALPPAVLADMGLRARQLAAGFSWAATASATRQVYSQVSA